MSGSAGRSESLQALVDALSATLRRPVLLDDATLRPLAYSAQSVGVGVARPAGVLDQDAASAVQRALDEQGIAELHGVVRTPGVPEIGMEERVCASVRDDDRDILGYLWVFDPHRELDAEALGRVASTAQRAARLLVTSKRPTAPDEQALIARLRSPHREERAHAALELRSRELLPDGPLVVCTIAAAELGVDAWASAHRMAQRLSAGHAIAGAVPVGATLIVSLADPAVAALPDEQVASWLHEQREHAIAIGQSAVLAGVDEVAEGCRQAEVALRIALARDVEARHAAWSALGADRLVSQLPAHVRTDLPPRLAQLLRDEPTLVATLSAFLDAAGDVKATAAALNLHRSGLYYRLRRIEELTGLQLDDGDDRLLAHLAVRLGRSV